jgi:hypothetical protein
MSTTNGKEVRWYWREEEELQLRTLVMVVDAFFNEHCGRTCWTWEGDDVGSEATGCEGEEGKPDREARQAG